MDKTIEILEKSVKFLKKQLLENWDKIEEEEIINIKRGLAETLNLIVIIKDKTNKGVVNERTVNYITKYITKTDEIHKEYKPIILASAGLGKKYIERYDSKNNKFRGKDTKETYTTRNGLELALPIYYRNKIYNDEEREKLWMNLLDKNVRYVNGR